MARTSIPLNFAREPQAAFTFYGSVFGTVPSRLMRFGEMPTQEGATPVAQADRDLLMYIELEILGGHVLMGTDAPESMGFSLTVGNTMHLNLEPDTLSEAQRLFGALSDGGKVGMALAPMFWGGVFGSCSDKFGVQWMINCATP